MIVLAGAQGRPRPAGLVPVVFAVARRSRSVVVGLDLPVARDLACARRRPTDRPVSDCRIAIASSCLPARHASAACACLAMTSGGGSELRQPPSTCSAKIGVLNLVVWADAPAPASPSAPASCVSSVVTRQIFLEHLQAADARIVGGEIVDQLARCPAGRLSSAPLRSRFAAPRWPSRTARCHCAASLIC